MSDKPDPVKYSAYDHLKKEVASKSLAKKANKTTVGLSTPLKGFFIAILIFAALLLSGVLTGPGPFNVNNDQDDFDNGYFNEGVDNSQALSSVCVQHTGLSAHYHFDLSIYLDGAPQVVPANVGIASSDCFRPIHTHDGSGHIHIELPSDYTGSAPSLGDFFSIWGQNISPTTLLDQSGSVSMFVNNNAQTGNFQFYVPSDGDEISLRLVSS